jgi:hypothetical protein
MMPNSVADKRTCLMETILIAAANNEQPTKYAQNRRPGIHGGTICTMKFALTKCSAPKTAKETGTNTRPKAARSSWVKDNCRRTGIKRHDQEKNSGELRPKKKTPINVAWNHMTLLGMPRRHSKRVTVRNCNTYFRIQSDRTARLVQGIEPFCDPIFVPTEVRI